MVGRMEIEDVHAVGAKLLQTSGEVLLQVLGLVDASLEWVDFGSKSKATLFPTSLARPCFLLAADIHARSINFIVALRLEVIEVFGKLIKLGDTRAAALIGAYSVLPGALEPPQCQRVPKVIKPRMTRSFGFCAIRGIERTISYVSVQMSCDVQRRLGGTTDMAHRLFVST